MGLQKPAPGAVLAADRSGIKSVAAADVDDGGTAFVTFATVAACRTDDERIGNLYQESALDAEQKKLESGKSTTYTVLQVQRDLTSARGSEIQALDTYNKSLSQLSLDEGTTLERLGIKFDVK